MHTLAIGYLILNLFGLLPGVRVYRQSVIKPRVDWDNPGVYVAFTITAFGIGMALTALGWT